MPPSQLQPLQAVKSEKHQALITDFWKTKKDPGQQKPQPEAPGVFKVPFPPKAKKKPKPAGSKPAASKPAASKPAASKLPAPKSAVTGSRPSESPKAIEANLSPNEGQLVVAPSATKSKPAGSGRTKKPFSILTPELFAGRKPAPKVAKLGKSVSPWSARTHGTEGCIILAEFF